MKEFNSWALKVKPLKGYFLKFCPLAQRSAILNHNLIVNTFERRNLNSFMFIVYFLHEEKTTRMKIIEKKLKNICKRVSFFCGFIFQGSCLHILKEPAKLRAYAPDPSLMRALLIIDTRLTRH